MAYFNFNGKFYSEESAVLSVNSRGLRYGDGLFETVKSMHGELHFIDEHFARLWQGLQVLQFILPRHFTPNKLQDDILALLEKNGHHNKARIRITVFRGDGGLYDPVNHTPNYLLQSWNLPEETGAWNSNGLVLGIYTDVKKSCDILSNLKHNNFLPYVMAAVHAKKHKWNDAVLLNTDSGICDTTIANIFLIKNEKIYTPALEEGCVAGVMRKNLVNLLSKANRKPVECRIVVDDLLNADEVFLTNSIYNMRWVQGIGDKKFVNYQSRNIYNDNFSTNS